MKGAVIEKGRGSRHLQQGVTMAKGRSRARLGTWKVRRVGDDRILITIPQGMAIKGRTLLIEDVIAAASNYLVVKKGRVLSCCSGNVAIASTGRAQGDPAP